MNKTYKTTVIILLTLGLLSIGYLLFDNKAEIVETLKFGGESNEPRDMFGTRSATSTTATAAGSFVGLDAGSGHATVTKALLLDGMTDMAIITFKAIDASSTSFFQYDIYASNDNGCDATATSSDDDTYDGHSPFIGDVNWYDIGASNTRLRGLVSNPSTTNASGTVEVLTDLSWKCLKVDLKGASTTVWTQLREHYNN